MKKDVLLWAGAGQIGWRLQDVSERVFCAMEGQRQALFMGR